MNADVGTGAAPASSTENGGAPVGPSSEEEAMFLAEQSEAGEGGALPVRLAKPEEVEDEKAQLPPLDDLVKRIPQPARDTLEELFRARFVTVKRVPKSALKN